MNSSIRDRHRFCATHLLLPGFLLCVAYDAVAAPPVLEWVVHGHEKLVLKEHDQTVMAFQLKMKSFNGQFTRANYVHPLIGPDGDVITEDFPQDHRHHRGIFWAWHQLLLNGKPLADPWVCKDIVWKIPEEPGCWVETRASSRSASMKVVREWVVPDPDHEGQSLRVVRETAAVTIWPASANTRVLDFDLRFRALVDGIEIGGSEDAKGYGGFSPRIRLADDVEFIGQTGKVTPQRLAATDGGAWMDVVGTFDGKRKGVAVMVHPSHPGFPVQWILRPKGSMQNAQWPGRIPHGLSTSECLKLRYRLVVHSDELDRDTLESMWLDFAESPTAD